MSSRSPLLLKPNVFLLLHSGSGTPFAMRVDLRKLSMLLALIAVAFLLFLTGTLGFFRELENNRKLENKVLELESREKLAIALQSAPRMLAATPQSATPPATIVATPVTPKQTTIAPVASVPDAAEKAETPAATAAPTPVNARIGDITPECEGQTCEIRVSMVPTSSGVVAGELLLVLETEIPRIGAGNPTTQVRKSYYSYPGLETRSEIDQEGLLTLRRKPFRFSRALQTVANFSIGKLLRPLAVNVYIFDREHNLVTHERKAIESDE